MSDLDIADQTVFIPRTVGPYRVENELGAGAMGTVFRALHTGLDREVALKVLRPDMLQDPDSVRRFLREARSVARLDHPHIVSVYDGGEIDSIYYIAMKLIEGGTLQAMLAKNGPLPPNRVIRLGSQLASALDYAHTRDVIHLDVKPANVMVASKDFATLTDFSIAQALNPGATRSATITGTPLYMSPEQIQGKDIDSRSDIYSLGLLLYEMLVGCPPFQGPFVTVMYAHLHTPVPDIREQAPATPEALAAVVDRALKKDRMQRYQTAGEMLRALERCVDKSTVSVDRTAVLDGEGAALDVTLPPADNAGAADRSTARAAATGAATATPALPAEEVAKRRSWQKPGLLAGGVLAIVLLALAGFLLRPQAATTGTLTITSSPPGASVAVDGVARGHAPLTVSKISDGAHRVQVSAPTYMAQQIPVTVSGGKSTSVRVALPSVPLKQLVSASGVLTSSFSRDQKTGNFLVGTRLTQISAAQARTNLTYSVVELKLASDVVGKRTVRVVPRYELYDPDGILVTSFNPHFPALTLDRQAPTRSFSAGFYLNPRTGTSAPPGNYSLRLLVNDQPLLTMSFRVTR